MGLQSIIVRIGDAISTRLRSRKCGENEWDVATLVLRIGAPKLLYILHKIKNNKQCNTIKTLEMDEIATDLRLRWSSNDNNVTFNCIEDAYVICEEIGCSLINKSKETLVVACGEIGNGGDIRPISTLPSCSKIESDQFVSMIDGTSELAAPDVIATDGDSMRKKVLNGRDKMILDEDATAKLSKLPLFDFHIVDGKHALYYNDKHNSKRLRGTVISNTRGYLNKLPDRQQCNIQGSIETHL